MEGHPLAYQVAFKKKGSSKPLRIPIVPKSYKITADTKIGVLRVDDEAALYYRDLWAHKMGATKSENYFLFTLDGMAFGVTGIMMGKVRRLVETDILEVFGFDQPLDNHPNAHKLFMMLLTCRDFKRILENTTKVNRISDIKGFKTACITKYRKLKSSTGLLKLTARERLPTGLYKLMYRTDFYPRSFQETLELWRREFDVQDLRKLVGGDDDDAYQHDEGREEARS